MNLVTNFYQREEPLRQLIRELAANPDALALDIACKKGDTAKSLAEHVRKLVALDREFFGEWREQGKSLSFVNGDALSLPFGNERFDTVVACECLQYLEKPLLAIEEIHRVLKPGGSLIMSFPEGSAAAYFLNPYNLAGWFKRWIGGKQSRYVKPVRAREILESCAERWRKDVFWRRGTLLFIYAAFMMEKLQVLRVLAKNRRRFWLCRLMLDPLVKGLFILMKADFSLSLSFMSYNNVIRLKKINV